MRPRSRFVVGVVLLVAGLLLGFGDLFLAVWSLKSGRALGLRGARLPALVLTQIAIATSMVATVTASLASRRTPVSIALRLTAPLVATAALFAALYLDPRASAWRAMRPLRRTVGLPGALALDAALVVAAVAVLHHRGRLRAATAVPVDAR